MRAIYALCFFTLACVKSDDGFANSEFGEIFQDWPIFDSIDRLLRRAIVPNDWVTLFSRGDRGRNHLAKSKEHSYPRFEDDCQIPNLHHMYKDILGYVQNGTFVEVGASGDSQR